MRHGESPNQQLRPQHPSLSSPGRQHFRWVMIAVMSIALTESASAIPDRSAVPSSDPMRVEPLHIAGVTATEPPATGEVTNQQESPIPNLIQSRNDAYESAAISRVRTLVTLELTYSAKYGKGYAPDLTTLGPDPAGKCHGYDDGSARHACMIDSTLGCTSGTSGSWCTKEAFRYSITGICKKGVCDDFVIVATPVDPSNGKRNFCATSDGASRSQIGPPLTSSISVSECQSWEPASIAASSLRSPKMANEAEGAYTVRWLITDELRYSNRYPAKGYAPDLASLGIGPDGKCQGGPAKGRACFAGGILGCTSGTSREWCIKSGFRYTITATCKAGLCDEFVAVGTPVDPSTGTRSFCATSDGVARGKAGPPLISPVSVSECRSWNPL